MKQRKLKKRLFTLIELIVVIVILGVLAAIVIPNISSWQKESEMTAVQSNLRNLQTSIDMYGLKNNGDLPGTVKPEPLKPAPIDFKDIHPDYTRNLPKTKGIKYWVDYKGMVWASTIDSPTNVNFDGANTLSWDNQEEAQKYNIYEVKNFTPTTGSVYKSVDYTFVKEVSEFTITSEGKVEVTGLEDKVYAVSAVDKEGFETPPAGGSYEGYDSYVKPANPDLESSEPVIKPKRLVEEVPAGWIGIYTVEDLEKVRVNSNSNYILMENLDLNGTVYDTGAGWNPIAKFTGEFDGNGLEIKGLYINRPTESKVGFFREISNATVKNLKLTDIDVTGQMYTGGLAGYHQYSGHSYIERVFVSGVVTGPNRSGGLVGSSTGNGSNRLFIKQSHVNATINGGGDAGGLVGKTNNSEIRDSYFVGHMKGIANIGGLVGDTTYAVIINSYAASTFADKSSSVGGVIGRDYGYTAPGEQSVYYDTEKAGFTGDASYRVIPKTTAEMFTKTTFNGWDFTNTWTISEGSNYPQLKWLVE